MGNGCISGKHVSTLAGRPKQNSAPPHPIYSEACAKPTSENCPVCREVSPSLGSFLLGLPSRLAASLHKHGLEPLLPLGCPQGPTHARQPAQARAYMSGRTSLSACRIWGPHFLPVYGRTLPFPPTTEAWVCYLPPKPSKLYCPCPSLC